MSAIGTEGLCPQGMSRTPSYAPILARVLPFALYMCFLAVGQGSNTLAGATVLNQDWNASLQFWLYPVKMLVVLVALCFYWSSYEELLVPGLSRWWHMATAVITGVLVYTVWINLEWSWATQGHSSGYNPFQDNNDMGPLLAGVRFFGAVVVVPIMEELFWRSFLLRYLISWKFQSVPLGSFTLLSCTITVILFGVEHNLWLAGMIAGLAYSLLVYRTRNLWSCIAAHATTNLLLGIYVLMTGEWRWW